ncbi:MAG: thioesterase family protein [Clostridiales bacterium]|nr:thioesterase family protein [Clostridiales bacterium]
MMLTIGMIKEKSAIVSEEQTAIRMHSGGLHVLATPAIIALMEEAALECVSIALEPEQTTVGTLVNIHHIAPTPVGSKVTAVAKLIEIDRKRLVFEVEAFDEQEKIGYGTHERFIVNGASFQEKCNQKAQ